MPRKAEFRANLSKLTIAERFWLWRRTMGLTQDEAAQQFGVHRKKYWKIEAGRLSADPLPPVLDWSLGDLCALARRRHGLRFRQTAKLVGISHVTLSHWEQDNDPRLVEFWRGMGYRFPWQRGRGQKGVPEGQPITPV